ncbi:MAG: hypothetical protein OXF62_01115 [Caldilineaceae bacterium]|nr:hypothetical protein [Caldilineaceae bacterium]
MARFGTALLVCLTIVLIVASIAYASEILLVDGAEGIELVDRQACEAVPGYYTENEVECDGFVLWLIYFVPLWMILGPVWLFYFVEPGWQKPRVSHGGIVREIMTRGAYSRR